MVEEDISGLPYREGQAERRTEPPLYEHIRAASAAGKTTALFLDELDKGRRSVCDTLLTLITNPRGTGPLQLPVETAIIAAANTPEWGGGDGIGDAMLSRFAIVPFAPDLKTWAKLTIDRYKSDFARQLVSDVISGVFPLLETTGEDWCEKRITSPRTIWLALDAISNKLPSIVPAISLVRGLLTPNAADRLISLYNASVNETRDAADKILRHQHAKQYHAPIRV
jgi:hypothetical protein